MSINVSRHKVRGTETNKADSFISGDIALFRISNISKASLSLAFPIHNATREMTSSVHRVEVHLD